LAIHSETMINNHGKFDQVYLDSFVSCPDSLLINKFISMINVPPHKLPLHKRVSEASLCYYKRFWTKQKYSDNSKGAEGEEFFKNRETRAFEISWKNIIVVLLHKGNVSKKEIPDTPNGSYFNFTDDEFLFITELDT